MISDKEKLQIISHLFDSENYIIPALIEEDWNDLFKFAQKQGISCYLYYSLRQKKSENLIPEDWQRKVNLQLMHYSAGNIKHLQELEEISLAFNKVQIPVIFLKGSHLAFHVYPSPSLRPMGDIDLFVREENVQKAIDTLLASGYRSNYFTLENLKKHTRHLPPFTRKGKKSIELHWTLIQPHFHTSGTEQTMNWLINATEEKQFGKSRALVFKPNAIVFQLMLHIGLNDGLRSSLKNLTDLTVLIQRFQKEIEWEVITNRILETSFARPYALVGWLANNMVGANIPYKFFQAMNVEISEEIKAAALSRILLFGDVGLIGPLPTLIPANLTQKLVIVMKYIFMSPSKMKFRHNLKNNWEVFTYYPRRVFEFTRKYKSNVLKTFNPDEELLDKSQKEIQLREWLER